MVYYTDTRYTYSTTKLIIKLHNIIENIQRNENLNQTIRLSDYDSMI